MRYRLLSTCMSFSLLCLSNFAQTTQMSPKDVIFAFDFHDVVVGFDWPRAASKLSKMVWNSGHKLEVIKNLYPILRDVRAFKKDRPVMDDILSKLAVKYPFLAGYVDPIIDLANTDVPYQDTVAVIKELKARGYKLYLASNISSKSYQLMQQREPEVLALFEGVYLVDRKRPGSDQVYSAALKPHSSFFHGFRDFVVDIDAENARRKIIFIDDKKANVIAARQSDDNLLGIHFTSAKKLENSLSKLDILR